MNASKIHVGAGTLTLNPDSEPVSFDSSSDGGLLNYAAEIEPINVDQVLAAVDYFVPGEECTFEMLVTEGDASTMQYVLGATDQSVTTQAADASNKAYTEIKFGGNTTLTDYVMEYKAPRRNATNCYVIIRLYKVNLNPNVEFAYKKDGVSFYKLSFKAKADTSKDAGQQLGYYRFETSDVTGGTATLAVSSTDPADGASGVAVDDVVDIVFNRNVDPSTITEGNFVLMTDAGVEVDREVAFTGDAGTNVTITPDANLSGSTTYLVCISSEVRANDDKTKMAAPVLVDITTT